MFEMNLRSKNSIENILIVNEYFTSDFYMAGSKNLELENNIKTNLEPLLILPSATAKLQLNISSRLCAVSVP